MILILLLYITGWMILLFTSANLLFPDSNAAKERLFYVLLDFTNTTTNTTTKTTTILLKLKILFHLLSTYFIILPLMSYFWFIDEYLLYTNYKQIQIIQPLITISCPRAGTTSFHRILALDIERYVTPTMLELVLPFICIQKVLWFLNKQFPFLTKHIEIFLKYINNVTKEVDERHPISLFIPDADDILLGEWHWISVGSIRTFPIKSKWFTNYQMSSNTQSNNNKKRSMKFHQIMCQKVLYNRGCGFSGFNNQQGKNENENKNNKKQLLLRSHLSPCIDDFQRLYPDCIIVGILRNPIDVLRSFAGLSNAAVYAASTNIINMLQEDKETTNEISTTERTEKFLWSHVFVDILSDMMGREATIYGSSNNYNNDDDTNNNQKQQQQQQLSTPGSRRRRYVTFTEFKDDPLNSIKNLYKNALDTKVSTKFENAIKSSYLIKHVDYKTKHIYHNPTLEEMNINEEEFLNIPNVKKYHELIIEIDGKKVNK